MSPKAKKQKKTEDEDPLQALLGAVRMALESSEEEEGMSAEHLAADEELQMPADGVASSRGGRSSAPATPAKKGAAAAACKAAAGKASPASTITNHQNAVLGASSDSSQHREDRVSELATQVPSAFQAPKAQGLAAGRQPRQRRPPAGLDLDEMAVAFGGELVPPQSQLHEMELCRAHSHAALQALAVQGSAELQALADHVSGASSLQRQASGPMLPSAGGTGGRGRRRARTSVPSLAAALGEEEEEELDLGHLTVAVGDDTDDEEGFTPRRKSGSPKAGVPGGPCAHCGSTESPQWRRPLAKKVVLCNACGIYYSRHHSLPKRKKGPGCPSAPGTNPPTPSKPSGPNAPGKPPLPPARSPLSKSSSGNARPRLATAASTAGPMPSAGAAAVGGMPGGSNVAAAAAAAAMVQGALPLTAAQAAAMVAAAGGVLPPPGWGGLSLPSLGSGHVSAFAAPAPARAGSGSIECDETLGELDDSQLAPPAAAWAPTPEQMAAAATALAMQAQTANQAALALALGALQAQANAPPPEAAAGSVAPADLAQAAAAANQALDEQVNALLQGLSGITGSGSTAAALLASPKAPKAISAAAAAAAAGANGSISSCSSNPASPGPASAKDAAAAGAGAPAAGSAASSPLQGLLGHIVAGKHTLESSDGCDAGLGAGGDQAALADSLAPTGLTIPSLQCQGNTLYGSETSVKRRTGGGGGSITLALASGPGATNGVGLVVDALGLRVRV